MTDVQERAAKALPVVAATLIDLPYEGWHFGDSVAFEGMILASDALGVGAFRSFARGFVRGWASRLSGFRPLDCTAAGHAMVDLARRDSDDAISDVARRLAEYLVSRRTVGGVYATWEQAPLREPYGPIGLDAHQRDLLADPGAGVFVDCLHFDPPFFAALGRLTGDARWTDEAVEQALGYVRLLQDSSGLFYHFHLERTGDRYALGWGRGQGWALLGLLDVIDAASEHPDLGAVRSAARRLATAMIQTQRPDGHWDAVVGRPASGNETSTAAFMARALPRAARLGVLDPAEVCAAAESALRATLDSIDDRGVLTGVSAEVWASTLDEHYWYVPRDFIVPWGQGPAALALCEAVLFDPTIPAPSVMVPS